MGRSCRIIEGGCESARQAEDFEDGEGGFEGDVGVVLFEAVEGRAADAGEDGELLLVKYVLPLCHLSE
jgi:hypothetical protein